MFLKVNLTRIQEARGSVLNTTTEMNKINF